MFNDLKIKFFYWLGHPRWSHEWPLLIRPWQHDKLKCVLTESYSIRIQLIICWYLKIHLDYCHVRFKNCAHVCSSVHVTFLLVVIKWGKRRSIVNWGPMGKAFVTSFTYWAPFPSAWRRWPIRLGQTDDIIPARQVVSRAPTALYWDRGKLKFVFGDLKKSPGLSWGHLNSRKLRCIAKCSKNHTVVGKRGVDYLINFKELVKVNILVWVSPLGGFKVRLIVA